MANEKESKEHDQYRSGVAVRNGWRCRFCGAYPKPGKSFGSDGVCPTCRDRLEHMRT